MDTAIKDGDFLTTSSGKAYLTDDINEIVQRCFIALTVPKGSNIYNRNFGSELCTIDFTDKRCNSQAELLVKEALLQAVPCAVVNNVTVTKNENGKHIVAVTITACDKQGKTEVII